MDINVFIQNLKDTTTVLQQLQVCIENIKETMSGVNTNSDSIELINGSLDTITRKIDNLNDDVIQLSQYTNSIMAKVLHKITLYNTETNEFVSFEIIDSNNRDLTSEEIQVYVEGVTGGVQCYGIYDTNTPRIAMSISHNGTTYTVDGSDIDLEDSGETDVTFTNIKQWRYKINA